MTFPLTPTVIVLSPSTADNNACAGTALPINLSHRKYQRFQLWRLTQSWRTALEHRQCARTNRLPLAAAKPAPTRSEEHTSELQSHSDLVCRLLLEKKNKKNNQQ